MIGSRGSPLNMNTTAATIQSLAALLKALAWPASVLTIALFYKADLKAIIPRLRKAGPSGVKLDPPLQQSVVITDLSGTISKPLPGIARTEAVEDLERILRQQISTIQDGDRIDRLILELSQARLTAHFERVYRVIFGTQILGIRRLNERKSPVDLDELKKFFLEYTAQFAAIYEHYGFEGWLAFMLNEMLVRQSAGIIEISPTGKDLLLYLTIKGLPEDKSY